MNVNPLTAVSAADARSVAGLAGARPQSRPLTGAALRNAPEAVQRAEVASQFEAILVRQLLAPTMTSMLGSDAGASASVYGDLMTDTFSQQLTRGGGLGLAPMLAKQLAPRASHQAQPPAA